MAKNYFETCTNRILKSPVVDPCKRSTLDWLKSKPEIIDPAMRSLVNQINSLPFLYTNYSCSGHIEKTDNGLLIINQEPCLGVELVHSNYETTQENIDNFIDFRLRIEKTMSLINTEYFKQYNQNLFVFKVISQKTTFKLLENKTKKDAFYDNFFYFLNSQKATELGTDLLNKINEGFHKVANHFCHTSINWSPLSDDAYLSLGKYNFFSQTKRARNAGLL
jgi:hypothetical protein